MDLYDISLIERFDMSNLVEKDGLWVDGETGLVVGIGPHFMKLLGESTARKGSYDSIFHLLDAIIVYVDIQDYTQTSVISVVGRTNLSGIRRGLAKNVTVLEWDGATRMLKQNFVGQMDACRVDRYVDNEPIYFDMQEDYHGTEVQTILELLYRRMMWRQFSGALFIKGDLPYAIKRCCTFGDSPNSIVFKGYGKGRLIMDVRDPSAMIKNRFGEDVEEKRIKDLTFLLTKHFHVVDEMGLEEFDFDVFCDWDLHTNFKSSGSLFYAYFMKFAPLELISSVKAMVQVPELEKFTGNLYYNNKDCEPGADMKTAYLQVMDGDEFGFEPSLIKTDVALLLNCSVTVPDETPNIRVTPICWNQEEKRRKDNKPNDYAMRYGKTRGLHLWKKDVKWLQKNIPGVHINRTGRIIYFHRDKSFAKWIKNEMDTKCVFTRQFVKRLYQRFFNIMQKRRKDCYVAPALISCLQRHYMYDTSVELYRNLGVKVTGMNSDCLYFKDKRSRDLSIGYLKEHSRWIWEPK